jgi:hypothetical protein
MCRRLPYHILTNKFSAENCCFCPYPVITGSDKNNHNISRANLTSERDGWLRERDGWLSREGWVAKSVARQLATAVLWVRIQTTLKNHKWAT